MYSAHATDTFPIMLVDDNETDIFLHGIVIEQSNFASSILTYDNGRKALDYLLSHKEEPSKLPILILLDLNMPIMDGFKFLEEFESFPEDIKQKCKIAILSSSENQKDIDAATNYKYVINYCVKPLTEEALKKIKQML